MGKCILLKSGSGGIDPDELTATKEDILINKLAGVSGSDEPVMGTMPNRGAVSQSLNCGNSYTIPPGYHNGSGKVTANSLSSQTSANATAGQILSGQTAWVNGSKITGSMSNRGAVSQGLGINGSYTIPAGYHNGSGKVTQSIPVQGGSTTTPGTANKTIVTANRYVNGNIIVAGSSNLTAGNIKKGINIFEVTGTFEGLASNPYYFYNNGKFSSLSGFNELSNSSSNGHSSFTIESTTLHFNMSVGSGSTAYSHRFVVSQNTIELTNYKYLDITYNFNHISGSAGYSAYCKVGLATTNVNSPALAAKTEKSLGAVSVTNQTIRVNVSSLTGYFYIHIDCYADTLRKYDVYIKMITGNNA